MNPIPMSCMTNNEFIKHVGDLLGLEYSDRIYKMLDESAKYNVQSAVDQKIDAEVQQHYDDLYSEHTVDLVKLYLIKIDDEYRIVQDLDNLLLGHGFKLIGSATSTDQLLAMLEKC